MRLPSYPLVTADPFFSIWSPSDRLYDADTVLWCGIKKRLSGYITVDSEKYRFMGTGKTKVIEQKEVIVEPYTTEYVFENDKVRLCVLFWTPLLLDDLYMLSLPCSFIDYSVEILDSISHNVSVTLCVHEEFCYDGRRKNVVFESSGNSECEWIRMGRQRQEPLSKTGDGVSADWGHIYLAGGELTFGEKRENALKSVLDFRSVSDRVFGGNIIAYDDGLSIEYFGEKLKALWTEKFENMARAISCCNAAREALLDSIYRQNEMIKNDAMPFGEGYKKILTAAARQVLAAHKLVRNSKGELLYLSKECHSNGCINTVDVSYPAVPMYLVYRPDLIKAMLTGVFEFSRMPIWQADYAPHDIGTYPVANGQVYALKKFSKNGALVNPRNVYKSTDFSIFDYNSQMPVEECGNMLIMSYAYYFVTGDVSQIKSNFALLQKWADYLVKAGVVLEDQLCTDDFAGHSEKNVNLAVKAVIAIECFGEICRVLNWNSSCDYRKTALQYAEQLLSVADCGEFLNFSLGKKKSWSMKYNMVWDILFGFDLFDENIYEKESRKYRIECNRYGVPLDSRRGFTKTDWMMWASCLDETRENTRMFAERIADFLSNTKDRNCFTDWYETDSAKECGMDHRSVQAGLWMPVLKKKIEDGELKVWRK